MKKKRSDNFLAPVVGIPVVMQRLEIQCLQRKHMGLTQIMDGELEVGYILIIFNK